MTRLCLKVKIIQEDSKILNCIFSIVTNFHSGSKKKEHNATQGTQTLNYGIRLLHYKVKPYLV